MTGVLYKFRSSLIGAVLGITLCVVCGLALIGLLSLIPDPSTDDLDSGLADPGPSHVPELERDPQLITYTPETSPMITFIPGTPLPASPLGHDPLVGRMPDFSQLEQGLSFADVEWLLVVEWFLSAELEGGGFKYKKYSWIIEPEKWLTAIFRDDLLMCWEWEGVWQWEQKAAEESPLPSPEVKTRIKPRVPDMDKEFR